MNKIYDIHTPSCTDERYIMAYLYIFMIEPISVWLILYKHMYLVHSRNCGGKLFYHRKLPRRRRKAEIA